MMGARGPLPGSGAHTRSILIALASTARTERQLQAMLSMPAAVLRVNLWRMAGAQGVLQRVPDHRGGRFFAYRINQVAKINADSRPYSYHLPTVERAGDRAARDLFDAFANIVAQSGAPPRRTAR